MKKIILFLCLINLANAFILERFTDPKLCADCHKNQYTMWSTSAHSLSHAKNNELFEKSVRLVSIDSHQSYEQTLVGCSNCHNPRLDVKRVSNQYVISKTFDIDITETKKVDTALGEKHVQNGISCYVCHNVDSIKERDDINQIGYQNFNWVEDDTITGPFDDPHQRAAEFHLSSKRDFFRKNNDLCNACHQGRGGKSDLSIYNTGKESDESGTDKLCIDCHMGRLGNEFIALNTKPEFKELRQTRPHRFLSVRNNISALTNAIDTKFDTDKQTIFIKNKIPHNIPSGFSGRSMVLTIEFLSSDNKVISKENHFFEKKYQNKLGLITLSYSAEYLFHDTTLKGNEVREIKLNLPRNTAKIKATLNYYLISDKLQKRLQVEDESFTKAYPVFDKVFEIK